jgi:ketosteroid isomerase-like protein
VTREDVNRWLVAYVEAWKSYDPDRIGALFSDDAEYRFRPHEEPRRGREAIVASWLEGTDVEGTYDADYRAVAVDGEMAVATGASTYLTEPGGSVDLVYDNCFVMRFDDDGRCREFTEWFLPRGPERLVLELRLVEDVAEDEIARRMGISEAQVSQIVGDAARKLLGDAADA